MNFTNQQLITIAYLASNAVGAGMLWASWKYTGIARIMYSLLFLAASWINASAALNNPGIYLDYSEVTIPIYKDFILGYFSSHITPIIFTIAVCQFLIGVSMLLKGLIFKAGTIGGLVFLLSISPLGVGAAFPATLLMAAGLYLLIFKAPRHYIWESKAFRKPRIQKDVMLFI